MCFSDMVKAHAKRVAELREHAVNEEATKTGLVMPFLHLLGYDPYDPRVVIPEFCADFGEKKACKVDYAIKRGDEIVMIVETKRVGEVLDGSKESQLQQYFQSLLPVKIGILTDGVIYKFYTDLDHLNVMDKKPFMIFDFSNTEETLIPELEKLCNDCFDIDTALGAAQELKYLGQIKRLVANEIEDPSDDLVRLFAKQVYDGHLIGRVVEEFRPRIKTAFEQHVNAIFYEWLDNAKQSGGSSAKISDDEDSPKVLEATTITILGNVQGNGIETTQDEIEGYHIVKAIMSKVVDPGRVFMRDTISYCGILLDNKNTRPICRLHFNAASVKYLETFDAEKNGTKHKLETLSDIYKNSDTLRAVVKYYDSDNS